MDVEELLKNPLPNTMSLEDAQERYVLAFRRLCEFQKNSRIPPDIDWMSPEMRAIYIYGMVTGQFREAGDVISFIACRKVLSLDQDRGEEILKRKGQI